jgi:hypothetical protein
MGMGCGGCGEGEGDAREPFTSTLASKCHRTPRKTKVNQAQPTRGDEA